MAGLCQSDPDRGEQKSEPCQEASEVIAGGGEHGIDRVSGASGEIVSAHPMFGFGMADDRLDG